MKNATMFVLCAVGALWAPRGAGADVLATFWETELDAPPGVDVYDLFASVTAETLVLNADLGDDTIDLPPDGVNTGLFSAMGAILDDSFVTLGGEDVSFARPFTITPSGSGSLADAAWFVIGGVPPEFHPNDYSSYALWLGRFVVDKHALLGGDIGGPGGDIQSRIFVGWTDDFGVGFGVFNIPHIPAPASLAVLLVGALTGSMPRRRFAERAGQF